MSHLANACSLHPLNMHRLIIVSFFIYAVLGISLIRESQTWKESFAFTELYCCKTSEVAEMALAVCHVTAISIRISLGRSKTQKELQSFAEARGFLYSHKNIDLFFKLYARRVRRQAGS